MPGRVELETIAQQWISLWCVPVDWGLFERLHSADFEDCSAAGRATTKKAFAEGLAHLVRAFPDLETKVEDMVIDEEAGRVALRWSARGTNRATFMGKGPTGRRTPITGIEIIEIRGGCIVSRWGEWDITAHTGRDGGALPPQRGNIGSRSSYTRALDRSLLAFFWDGVRVTLRRPGQA